MSGENRQAAFGDLHRFSILDVHLRIFGWLVFGYNRGRAAVIDHGVPGAAGLVCPFPAVATRGAPASRWGSFRAEPR
jgi:hypothetical protein